MNFFSLENIDSVNISPKNLLLQIFSRELNKGRISSWSECLEELPLNLEENQKKDLLNYYSIFSEFNFLKNILIIPAYEYLFHSPHHIQVQSKDGIKRILNTNLSPEEWQLWLECLSIKFHQNWNFENPFCSFYLSLFGQKFRASLIHYSTSPLSISKLILRAINHDIIPLSSFHLGGTLKELLKKKPNILIAGSTGSGKTTLLSSLLHETPQDDHLIILEDTFEIQTKGSNVTRFLARENEKNSLQSYLSYCLRLTPDRLVVGEMRSHEVVPYILAMNTGLRGLFSTIHSSSAVDAIQRLGMLFSLYNQTETFNYDSLINLICKNLDYVVFMEDKKVKEVIQVFGSERGIPYFEPLILN